MGDMLACQQTVKTYQEHHLPVKMKLEELTVPTDAQMCEYEMTSKPDSVFQVRATWVSIRFLYAAHQADVSDVP